MLDFLGRISAYWAGLPSLYLLLFVLVIWVVFALILLADARNKLNQWCFIGGMAFSVGVFKEYLYYGIGPSLIASGAWTVSGAQLLYSILSAAFYLLSIPCVLMFAFYFARLNQTRVFPLLRVAVWLPAVYLGLLFPPVRTLPLQSNPVFCLSTRATTGSAAAPPRPSYCARFAQIGAAAFTASAALWPSAFCSRSGYGSSRLFPITRSAFQT